MSDVHEDSDLDVVPASSPDAETTATANGKISAAAVLGYLRKKHGREPTDDDLLGFAQGMREAADGLVLLVEHRRSALTLGDVAAVPPPPPRKAKPKRRKPPRAATPSVSNICSCGVFGHTEDLCPEKA